MTAGKGVAIVNHDAGASRQDDMGQEDTWPDPTGGGPASGDHGDVMRSRDAADVLADLETTAAERSRVERGLLVVARELLAVTWAALLGHKGFSSVEELSTTERRRWRTEAKRLCVAEVRVRLGLGEREARALIGVSCAPADVRDHVLGALGRAEVSWGLVRGFWERCGRLPADRVGLVAASLFGDEPETAAPERLDADGGLGDAPWQHADYWAALEREAVRVEGQDVQAERERRRAAYRARRSWLSVHDDGTATLSVTGPLTTMAGIHARVEHAVRALRKAGDPRTLDQLRSDVPSALLLYGHLPLPHAAPAPGSAARVITDVLGDAGPTEAPTTDVGVGEEALTVADLESIARIVSASPPVNLQVVVPWDAVAGRASMKRPTMGHGAPGAPSDPGARGDPGGPGRHDAAARGCVGQVLGHHPAFISPGHARELAWCRAPP